MTDLAADLDLPVALLAGGLATRMRPLTTKIPKSLLPLAGQPFLTHQLKLLKVQGIRRVVICTGHLGEQIEEQYGDGAAHGVAIRYSRDGDVLRGTGGALRNALPLLGDGAFGVIYGDSYLPIDLAPVVRSFRESGQPALMTVYHNEGRYDTSNVWFEDGHLRVYDKKNRVPQMQHIDYGLSILTPGIFERSPENEPFDLALILQELVREGRMAGYEVKQRFFEIGSPEGLKDLETRLQAGGPLIEGT